MVSWTLNSTYTFIIKYDTINRYVIKSTFQFLVNKEVNYEISSTSIAKLSKNENVNTDILRKICNALQCDISDIMEMVEDDSEGGLDND